MGYDCYWTGAMNSISPHSPHKQTIFSPSLSHTHIHIKHAHSHTQSLSHPHIHTLSLSLSPTPLDRLLALPLAVIIQATIITLISVPLSLYFNRTGQKQNTIFDGI